MKLCMRQDTLIPQTSLECRLNRVEGAREIGAKPPFTRHMFRVERASSYPARVLATGGKPSTWLPPGTSKSKLALPSNKFLKFSCCKIQQNNKILIILSKIKQNLRNSAKSEKSKNLKRTEVFTRCMDRHKTLHAARCDDYLG